tara:strand:+ start:1938 stop:2729 length:792 start_codon:yes stop_codon:yes gene_type:complete
MSSGAAKGIVVAHESARRLAKDVRMVMKDTSLAEDGIFYKHDEDNILKGYGVVVGPKDTPYSGGFYLFEFNYPADYPTTPPTVLFMTNDGKTRFNPNLYKNSKVCISLLNTWKGDGWTGCMTIRTILITLQSLLIEEPLLNEPGIKITHPEVKNYREIIEFRSLQYAHIELVSGLVRNIPQIFPFQFTRFKDEIVDSFLKWHEYQLEKIVNLKLREEKLGFTLPNVRVITSKLYGGMVCQLDYSILETRIKCIHNEIMESRQN